MPKAAPSPIFSQKIYFSNKPLVLTAEAESYKKEHAAANGYLCLHGAFPRNFRMAINYLNGPGTIGAIIEDISPAALQEELHKIYEPIDAAGGVVEDEKGRVLMMYRHGRWDLPKGKRDPGESLEDCALREVQEETGLQELDLRYKVGDTYHIYSQNGQKLLKKTTWYAMAGHSEGKLFPQFSEGITDLRWVAQGDLGPLIFKSYEAVREVLLEAGYHW